MADSFIQVPVDSTGKLVDTSQLTVGLNTVQRERVNIADPTNAAQIATVNASNQLAVSIGNASLAVTQSTSPWLTRPTDGTNPVTQTYNTNTGGSEYVEGVVIRRITAGASTEVGTSTTPIRNDPTGTTVQPVSGTVTANVGTTNGLALDTSVNALSLAQGAATSGQKAVLVEGAVTTAAPAYTTGNSNPLSLNTSGGLRVDGSGVTQPVSGTVTTTPPANASTNVAQFGGTNVVTGTGAGGSGIPRVTISNDSSLAANQSVNNAQVNGATIAVLGAGEQKVAIEGLAASGAAVSGNPILNGGRAATANPTAVTDGQAVDVMCDKVGRIVLSTSHVRALVTSATVTISTTTETTVLAAVAATFLDLTAIIISNTSATATRVDIRDTTAGTVIMSFEAPATQTVGAVFTTPQPQTAVNTNWTAQLGTAVTDVRVFMQAVKNI